MIDFLLLWSPYLQQKEGTTKIMTTEPVAALSLFYCYALEESTIVTIIERHIALLKRQGLLKTWNTPDQRLIALPRQIESYLNSADIVLPIVSSHLFANETQIEHALQRHEAGLTRVIPILAKPADFQHSPLKFLQILPQTGQPISTISNQDTAYAEIMRIIRMVIQDIQQQRSS
jgi:hypothetical protein